MKDKKKFSFINFFENLTTKQAIWIIVIVGFILYAPAIKGEFVFDDIYNIVKNPVVHATNGFFQVFVSHDQNLANFRFYRPVHYAAYSLIYSLFGLDTFFYHFFQFCIHFINSVVFYLFFKKFFSRAVAFFLAMIFLVHPINTETVSYIAFLQDTLYFLFGFIAIYIFARIEKLERLSWILVGLLLFLSLLSKEAGIVFFPVFFLVSIFFKPKSYKQTLGIFGIVLLIYLIMRYGIAGNSQIFSPGIPGSGFNMEILKYNFLSAPKMIYYYIKTFFFPESLAINQLWLVQEMNWNDFFFPLLIDLFVFTLITLEMIYLRNKKRELKIYFLFLTWFALGMIISLPLWMLDMTVADHWFYFPEAGFLGLIGLAIVSIQPVVEQKNMTQMCIIFLVILLSMLGIRTVVRNTNYQTRLSLYRHDAPIANNIVLYRLLENELITLGHYDEAGVVLKKVISLNPDDPYNWYYKGIINDQLGRYAQARQDYEHLFDTDYDELAYKALVSSQIKENNLREAQKIILEGVKKYPEKVQMWKILMEVSNALGDATEASQAAVQIKILLNNN